MIYLSPVFVLQFVLQVLALVSLWRGRAVSGNRWLWTAVIVPFGFVGLAIFYFFARKDETAGPPLGSAPSA